MPEITTMEIARRHYECVRRLPASLFKMLSLFVVMLAVSCGHSGKPAMHSDALVCIDDSVLTESWVVSRIPVGIEASDSIALFQNIVDKWIEGMVLTDMAKTKLPDMDEIDRKVNEYRNRLIVAEYLKKMRAGRQFRINPDSVRRFYDMHRSEMISENPLVKGIYLKIPENATGLEEIKECVFSATDKSIDRLENNWIGQALQYDYFQNRWVDWEIISEQIPYRFYDTDAFLSMTKNFETTCNGSVYLLHISDYLPSGSELPFDFASSRIMSIFERERIDSYEEALVRSLVKKAIADGRLVAVGYDPVSRRRVTHNLEKEKILDKNEK